MREQITLYQKKLADKESQCLKKDDELKRKKKELEKLRRLLEDKERDTPGQCKNSLGGSGMNKSFDIAHQNNHVLKFDDLMNTSIDLITNKIQSKHNKSRDRSPSVPKLDFKQIKELQEQDWMAYSKKLEDSIKVLNQRIVMIEDEKDKIMQKYNKLAANNTKLYELNEKLN